MGFFLFVLVNLALFLRPSEVFGIEELERVYQVLISACLAVSLPAILKCILGKSLACQPVTLCVFGILLLVPLAYLAAFDWSEAFRTEVYFLKVVIYYVLLISLVNTPRRLRQFLGWVLVFAMVLALVSVLRAQHARRHYPGKLEDRHQRRSRRLHWRKSSGPPAHGHGHLPGPQ